MSRIILLDTGPLGMLAHPRPTPEIVAWLRRLLQEPAMVIVPEIADYELRRELLRINSTKGIERLNELKMILNTSL